MNNPPGSPIISDCQQHPPQSIWASAAKHINVSPLLHAFQRQNHMLFTSGCATFLGARRGILPRQRGILPRRRGILPRRRGILPRPRGGRASVLNMHAFIEIIQKHSSRTQNPMKNP